VLFNSETQIVPVASAEQANIQHAIDAVRATRLRGGTDLQAALKAGLEQSASSGASNTYLVVLSDGGATRGPILNGKVAAWYASAWKQLPDTQRPRTYILAVGDDANLPLFRLLAQQDGLLEHVLSTEPMEFKLNSFLSKIGRSPVGQLELSISPVDAVHTVYPLQAATFSGSLASWVGQYDKPQENVSFTVRGVRDGTPVQIAGKISLPKESSDHPQLPRLWARARVDALLEKIERDGEDQATIVSVIAVFPFGLVQPLRHLSSEDFWQTRFLAPTDMQDGTYTVRLILRDQAGHSYRESKTFVIASKPPVVHVKLDRKRFQRGQSIVMKVTASETTRTLVARMDGAAPVPLRWDAKSGANTGALTIPDQMIPGTYKLTVTAEDIAHNIGTQEVQVEVLP
jgi:Ca-activated chloride channel family protein